MLKRMSLAIFLALLITPLNLHAQEITPTPEIATFTSDDDLLTFEYLADWFVEGRLYPFMNMIAIVNQEEMLPMVSTAYLLPGQATIMVQVLPLADFEFAGLSAETSIEDLEAALTEIMGLGSPEDEVIFSAYEHPDYEAMAGEFYIAQQDSSAYGIWLLPGNGVVIQIAIVVQGKVEIPHTDVVNMIADTVSFSGTAEHISVFQMDSEDFSGAFEEVFAEWMANDQRNMEILAEMEANDD